MIRNWPKLQVSLRYKSVICNRNLVYSSGSQSGIAYDGSTTKKKSSTSSVLKIYTGVFFYLRNEVTLSDINQTVPVH